MKNVFKTKKSLQYAIENPERIKGFQEYLDMNFAYLFCDLDGEAAKEALDGGLFEIPYWLEKYHNKETKDGENKYWGEYVGGHFESKSIGEIHEIEGREYKYADSQSLPEEIEHQAEDGDLAYEYRGSSFLRVWKLLE